ncbi:MAG: MBL fold metallo-hydrolase [Nanoarchaeota archaeon]|nr:MBL fold metallo-hydrolase [Nanoarchaeota archaeon]
MRFTSLASGSSGNCYLVSSKQGDVLIDAGISLRNIKKRLSAVGKDLENVQGCFLSHEHSDHVKAAPKLLDAGVPVFANRGTAEAMGHSGMRLFTTDEAFDFLGMRILPFSKSHDAAEPVSFTLREGMHALSVLTDVGYVSKKVAESVKLANAVVVEANHDVFMLKQGPYPEELKKRILGKQGHLSNYESALLLLEHASPALQHVVLGHLSETNNSPKVALQTFKNILQERVDLQSVQIHVAPPDEALPLLELL